MDYINPKVQSISNFHPFIPYLPIANIKSIKNMPGLIFQIIGYSCILNTNAKA